MQHWRQRASALDGERSAWKRDLPHKLAPTLGKLHVPLLREMLRAAEHDDRDFLVDLMQGFPVSGPVHAGGIGRAFQRPRLVHGRPVLGEAPRLEDLQQHCWAINQRTLAKAAPGPFAREVWEKHKQELRAGKVGPPLPLQAVDLHNVLLVERFGVQEIREGRLKVRIIDNFAKKTT